MELFYWSKTYLKNFCMKESKGSTIIRRKLISGGCCESFSSINEPARYILLSIWKEWRSILKYISSFWKEMKETFVLYILKHVCIRQLLIKMCNMFDVIFQSSALNLIWVFAWKSSAFQAWNCFTTHTQFLMVWFLT